MYTCMCLHTHTYYNLFQISFVNFGACLPKAFVFATIKDQHCFGKSTQLPGYVSGALNHFEDRIYIPDLLPCF